MRIFVAGATGAVGQQLLPRLTAQGHQVTATTRSPAKVERLRALGAEPTVVDGLDAMAVGEAVARAEPEVVIHQMTSLAGAFSLRRFDRVFAVTNRLRTQGTDHLLAAASAAGVRRFIAQSYTGWPNIREGVPVKTEDDPLDPSPPRAQRESLAAIRHLERVVPAAAPMEGIVMLGAVSEAEDIVQEAFLRYHRAESGRDGKIDSPKAFLSAVTTRLCIDHLRSDSRLINVFVLDIADGQVQAVRSVINPEKLRHLGPLADMPGLRRQLRPPV